jgi:hypothetical protein
VAQIGAVIGREFSHTLIAAVARKAEPELRSALDRVIGPGLLFRQGVAPHATYLFKHALVQDAAYGTLLREPRRKLHARIAETLESQFAEISKNRPEVLARHCTEAGLIEKAAALWGKAGLRSLDDCALRPRDNEPCSAVWRRHQGVGPVLSDDSFVDAWLSRRRSHRRCASVRECAQDWPCGRVDARSRAYTKNVCPVWKLCSSKRPGQ